MQLALGLLLALLPRQGSEEPPRPPNPSQFGSSFTFCGDADGDGRADYGIGSMLEGGGVVRVYSGQTGKIMTTLAAPDGVHDFGARLACVRLSGADYLVTAGKAAEDDVVQLWSVGSWKPSREVRWKTESKYFQAELVALGDLDGDGDDELLAGTALGSLRILSKRELEEIATFVPPGEPSCSRYGRVTALGDLDGDGRAEFAVDARSSVLVCSLGREGVEVVAEAKLEQACAKKGCSAMADLDGDGVMDLAIGLPSHDPLERKSHVRFFSGKDGAPLGLLESPGFSSGYGHSLLLVDDIAEDGVRDLYVARYEAFVDAVLAFSGRTGERLFDIPAPDDADVADLGWRMSVGGDVDGDGARDVLASRYTPMATGGDGQGVYVLSGAAPRIIRRHVLPLPD
jgi:hypothetical protein